MKINFYNDKLKIYFKMELDSILFSKISIFFIVFFDKLYKFYKQTNKSIKNCLKSPNGRKT